MAMRAAQAAEPGPPQNVLGAEALRRLLVIVGKAAESAVEPSAMAEARVADGARRVRATLPTEDAARIDALERFGDPGRALPVDRLSFESLRDLYAWTEALIDIRSPREARLFRIGQRVLAGVLLVAALQALFGNRNLARNAGVVVSASSICPYTPPAPLGRDRLYRLVDGIRVEGDVAGAEWSHGTYAMCTETQLHPWITVDLGRERTIADVVVYNRADCCWGIDDTPVALQLSSNNRDFVTVGTRTDPFSDDFPVRLSAGRRRARFVRLFNPADTPKNMVFGEIEIHGR